MNSEQPTTNNKNKFNLGLDLRYVALALLSVIVIMLLIWKPWQPKLSANSRTVQVTGEATIKAVPDEYAFYPIYEFTNADKQAALSESNAKSAEVVAKLKELEVPNNKIKASTNSYGNYKPMPTDATEQTTYSLSLTVTVDKEDLAQKVQDYLASTAPIGSVSPQPTFKTETRKSLESRARGQATKDARTKAEQNAQNLGFKLGAIKEVADGQGFSTLQNEGPTPSIATTDGRSVGTGMQLQPGENEINYTITVTYFVK